MRHDMCTNPCTAWHLSIWRSCAGPSPTSRGAVTSALQRVDFCSHLAITYQRRAFSYAGPSAWNYFPEHLRAPDLTLKINTDDTCSALEIFISDSGLYKFTFYIYIYIYIQCNNQLMFVMQLLLCCLDLYTFRGSLFHAVLWTCVNSLRSSVSNHL